MDESFLPRIIPRKEHSISRQNIDPDALQVLYRLRNHGFLAYLVGGCVRDLLLGKPPKDFDVATDAHPRQIRALFRNSRLIGRRFRLAHVYFPGGKFIEVSTFRRRSEFDPLGEENHLRSENAFGTPAEDAFRRDITINGIFYNIADFSLVDYVGGMEDLRRGVIRCIGDPEEKFLHDPVRMIRVIRHSARTGFPIEENTYRSLLTHAERVRLCSPPRVRDEFLRELKEGSAKESMKLMMETGVLFALFPSFLAPLQEKGKDDFFLNCAGILDELRLSGASYPDEFYLALFLLPLFGFFCPHDGFPRGRQGQGDFQLAVRRWVLETLGPLHFPRHTKDAVAHLLGAQRIFQELPAEGKLPWRWVRKPFFHAALQLFQLGTKSRGGEMPRFFCTSEEKPFRRRKRKRRRQKKNPGLKPIPQETRPMEPNL